MRLFLTFLGALFGGVGVYFKVEERNATKRMKEAEVERELADRRLAKADDRMRGFQLPVKTPFPEMRNSVLLVGLGGVGKTSFINKLLDSDAARPEIATDSFDIYRYGVVLPDNEKPSTCWIYMSDYAGQDLGSLVRAFVEQQRLSYSPMRYGHINSLILLVDLMPAPATGAAKHETAEEPNSDRVQQHSLLSKLAF